MLQYLHQSVLFGDYVKVGLSTISLVDADSFCVDGYVEETTLAPIHVCDSAQIKLMGHSQIVRGRWSRLAADVLITQLGDKRFAWGGADLRAAGTARDTYIAALKAAEITISNRS